MRIRTHLATEIKKDVKSDLKRARKIRLSWTGGLCVMIGTLLIGGVLLHFGRFELARPVLLSMTAIGFVIAIKWDLRQHAWFWIALTVLAVLHVAFILAVPWTTNWVPAAVNSGMCTIEFFVMLVIVDFLEEMVQRREMREKPVAPELD